MATPERPKRVSLSKKQLEEGAAIELIALLKEITSDGRVTREEAIELRRWLDGASGLEFAGVVYLKQILEHVLQDGFLSPDEQKTLYAAIEGVLPLEERRRAKEQRKAAVEIDRLSQAAVKAEARRIEQAQKPIGRFDVTVMGTHIGNRPLNIDRFCKVGSFPLLTREPSNPYDSNAVVVGFNESTSYGYVPKGEADAVARLLDGGGSYLAVVKKIYQGNYREVPIVVIEIFGPDAKQSGLKKPLTREFVDEGLGSAATESLASDRHRSSQKSASGAGCCLGMVVLPVLFALGVFLMYLFV
jgi:hypothetical protein